MFEPPLFPQLRGDNTESVTEEQPSVLVAAMVGGTGEGKGCDVPHSSHQRCRVTPMPSCISASVARSPKTEALFVVYTAVEYAIMLNLDS